MNNSMDDLDVAVRRHDWSCPISAGGIVCTCGAAHAQAELERMRSKLAVLDWIVSTDVREVMISSMKAYAKKYGLVHLRAEIALIIDRVLK